MKVLVVGAGGYVGRRLCDRLAADGHEIRRVSSSDGTGLDPETGLLPAAFQVEAGTDTVVYLAHSPFHRDLPARMGHVFNVHAVSVAEVAERAVAVGASRFVYVSTGSVYRPAWGPLAETAPLRTDDLYALSKIAAETALHDFRDDLDVTVFRPFGLYGPGQSGRLVANVLASVAAGERVWLERSRRDPSDTGGLRISLCYIDDAIACLCQAARGAAGPVVANLAGGEALAIADLARRLGTLLGKPPALRLLDDAYRSGDLVADVSLLRQHFHVNFTPVATGLARVVEAWQA